MKQIPNETVVYIYDTALEITFLIQGKNIPATMIDPEEYEEIEITNVRVQDLDIEVLEFLSESQIDKIKSKIIENISA